MRARHIGNDDSLDAELQELFSDAFAETKEAIDVDERHRQWIAGHQLRSSNSQLVQPTRRWWTTWTPVGLTVAVAVGLVLLLARPAPQTLQSVGVDPSAESDAVAGTKSGATTTTAPEADPDDSVTTVDTSVTTVDGPAPTISDPKSTVDTSPQTSEPPTEPTTATTVATPTTETTSDADDPDPDPDPEMIVTIDARTVDDVPVTGATLISDDPIRDGPDGTYLLPQQCQLVTLHAPDGYYIESGSKPITRTNPFEVCPSAEDPRNTTISIRVVAIE